MRISLPLIGGLDWWLGGQGVASHLLSAKARDRVKSPNQHSKPHMGVDQRVCDIRDDHWLEKH